MTGNTNQNLLPSNPNQPRTIRARTGMTTDPLPPGKKLEEKEFPDITPAKHDGDQQGQELSKDDIKAHKAELQHMQHKDPKHGGEPNNLTKTDPISSSASTKPGREPKI